ncbi:MAG: sigma-E factor negative regulatory protein [Burkholderiales bacterium]|jgi:negative regulator of sigma E activity|nr:sigma-E factor negative regulatory protein [Burkholderiales bacterium]
MVTNRLIDEAAMREKISQWMDGEGDAGSVVFAELESEAGRDAWVLYHCIGDMLRDGAQSGVSMLSPEFTARVVRRLENEQTAQKLEVVASRKVIAFKTRANYRVWALAATIACVVAIGGWMFALRHDASHHIDAPTMAWDTTAKLSITTLAATHNNDQTAEAAIPLDYLITYQEFLPPASSWFGVNVYQWASEAVALHWVSE